jgi:hypothetical protein
MEGDDTCQRDADKSQPYFIDEGGLFITMMDKYLLFLDFSGIYSQTCYFDSRKRKDFT